ncbi:MAG TPA: serine/threonine-protein kinase [Polyangia bacterium]|nr:serine/threonine-protein kinase [Polyangia bacterium]
MPPEQSPPAPAPPAAARPADPPLAEPPPARPRPFAPGDVLDDAYRIIGTLATGGMGDVYVAGHLRLPRTLAIKTLHPELAARHDSVARFCREACVLAQLRHPNVVQVHDFNVSPTGVPYIAMELVEGVDLRSELDRGRRFDLREIVSIVRQVASALDAAHAAGVVHRDLKPENVVLTRAAGQLPVVKVIDFGLSLCGWSARVTGDFTVFGTPDYMAPEQAQGLREQTDARTDEFALAALAYTLLAGRPPFARETPVAVLYAVVHEDPATLEPAAGWDVGPVERVLRKGMSREREARYPTVLAFADALEAALVEGGALGLPAVGPPLPLVPGARQHEGGEEERTPSRPRCRRRRATPGLRRGAQMLLASAVVAGALWGGLARGKAGAGWRHLHGLFAERSGP